MKPTTCPACNGLWTAPITRAEMLAELIGGINAPIKPCAFCDGGKTQLFIHRRKYYTAEAAKQWRDNRKTEK